MKCTECAPAFYGPLRLLRKILQDVLKGMERVMGDKVRLSKLSEYNAVVSMRSCFPQIAQKVREYHTHMLHGRWQQADLAKELEGV